MFTAYILTDIEINAPKDKVWGIVMDMNNWESWNPFVIRATTDTTPPTVGKHLQIKVRPVQSKPNKIFSFTPKVLACDIGTEFRWKGSLPVPGMFVGEHWFKVEEVAGKPGVTKLIHGEDFWGMLIPLMKGDLKESENSFGLMNRALKALAEGQT